MGKSPTPHEGLHTKKHRPLWKALRLATVLETSVSVLQELLPEGRAGAIRAQKHRVNRLLGRQLCFQRTPVVGG